MTLFELLGIGVVVATAAVLIALAVVVIRNAPRSKAGELVGAGDFETALDSADTGAGAERDELMAAAFAAKHTMELDRARGLVDRVLADDPADGEAWLERGLIEAYDGDHAAALDSLAEAGRHRADLLESIANSSTTWGPVTLSSRSGSSRPPTSGRLSARASSERGPGTRPGRLRHKANWSLRFAEILHNFGGFCSQFRRTPLGIIHRQRAPRQPESSCEQHPKFWSSGSFLSPERAAPGTARR
jgi:hypothetical protein